MKGINAVIFLEQAFRKSCFVTSNASVLKMSHKGLQATAQAEEQSLRNYRNPRTATWGHQPTDSGLASRDMVSVTNMHTLPYSNISLPNFIFAIFHLTLD
jgi:hypothetical protein